MKKTLLTFLTIMVSLTALAYDYPYLAIQTTDGTTKSINVESLSLSFSDGQLIATNTDGTQSFTLTELSKMYFTTDSNSGIKDILSGLSNSNGEVYDLQGRRIALKEMRRGIYVVKDSYGTRKINVK